MLPSFVTQWQAAMPRTSTTKVTLVHAEPGTVGPHEKSVRAGATISVLHQMREVSSILFSNLLLLVNGYHPTVIKGYIP